MSKTKEQSYKQPDRYVNQKKLGIEKKSNSPLERK